MPASDIFGLPTVILSSVGGVEVDAIISESHRYDALVTRNPLEDGSTVSDHVVNQPVVLEMSGRLSDTPLALLSEGETTLAEALADGVTPSPAKEKAQALMALREQRRTFDAVTGLQVYSNMVFERLEFPRARSDGRSIRFYAVLRELVIVGGAESSNRNRIVADIWHTALAPANAGLVPKALTGLIPY